MLVNESILVITVGAFVALVISSLNRPPRGVDYGLQLSRIERKIDLIIGHLGLKFDDAVHHRQLPATVVDLARAGRKIEAIKEYRHLTGASLVDAKKDVEAAMEHPPTGNDASGHDR